ncbi:MAG: serine/threonine-protein kinase [Candidatus Korobacteraceae bacterium]
MSQENRRMGDYEILGELGSGGMGRVYRVRNVLSDRVEAMKVLLPDLAGRQELAARFLREIKVLASLNHPNIAQLRTAVTLDNQLVMIMEYVEGTSLAARIERGPIAPSDALNYIDQVLNALSYAHSMHVIHRDIKPANMMLTPQGIVKLMDFGIARSEADSGLTMTGSTLGSLSYMSPEQTMGEATDARSDLYSVGVSIYEMVTGQRPFQGDSDFAIMAAQVKEMPKPPIELQPGLPTTLNDIILMSIAKDPGQRFQSADAFRNALTSVRSATPTPQPGMRGGTMLDTPVPTNLDPNAPTATASHAFAAPAATMLDAKVTPRPSGPMATMLDAKVTPRPSAGATGTILDAKVTPRPGGATGTVLDARVTPATPLPAPPAPSSHRGLYMALGAVVMLAGLVVAALYLQGHSKTEAKTTTTATDTSKTVTSTPTPAPTPAPTPPVAKAATTPPPNAAAQAAAARAQAQMEAAQAAKAALRKQQLMASAKMGAPGPNPGAPPAPAAPQPDVPNSAQMDELEHQIDQLTARAAAVNNSLDTMQRQQQASGYGMRGDIVAKQASMKMNLSKAQEAFDHHDAARAERYAALTQSDLSTLEHFLGR